MHHHHHHHHTTYHPPPRPPHIPPPPHRPPPPPPPPPPEVLEGDASSGPPRCYFCGQLIPEEQVARKEYHVGHGHKIFVFTCPPCRVTSADGRGESTPQLPAGMC